MMEGGSFSISSTNGPVNKTVTTVFSPDTFTTSYTYSVYKDGKVISENSVNDGTNATISFEDSGNYYVLVNLQKVDGMVLKVKSGEYVIDKEPPVLSVNESSISIYKGENFSANGLVFAYDNNDGDLTSKIANNSNDIDFSQSGNHKLVYTVSDEAGNVASSSINVNVMGSSIYLLIFQMIIIVCLICAGYIMVRFIKMLKLERRIEPFVISPLKDNTESLFDKCIRIYRRWLEFLMKFLSKSTVLEKYSKKFDKYSNVSVLHRNGLEILGGKITVSLLFLIVAVFAKTIKLKLMVSYEMVLPLLVGFFLLDVLYFIKYKHYRAKLENDLLSAIIVMNNAFKSGRSITQAIDIVSNEVKGVIGNEFRKMSLELSYGLGVETVFKRFASRVNLEEVNYLTASLTILNKTGGNITEVFSSIEKTLFNKKKLRLELKSLTSSSRIIVYVLLAVPFLFILFVSLITPDYFLPFVTTKLGIILMIFMIIYYIIFIICVRKIMRVVI